MSQVSMQDILALLNEAWVPEQKKEQLRNMVLDSIDMAEEMTKTMKSHMGDK